MNVLDKYIQDWKSKIINVPIIIFIGGYAGTGKSTLADKIKNEHLPMSSIFTTGLLREVCKEFIPKNDAPYLYSSTYKLHEYVVNNSLKMSVSELFIEQRKIVEKLLPRVIDFCIQEKQIAIINGNHVNPKVVKLLSEKYEGRIFPIEIYLKTSNPNVHKNLIEGHTHSRNLTNNDFKSARILQNFLLKEMKYHNVAVYEFDVKLDYIVEDMKCQLLKMIENYE